MLNKRFDLRDYRVLVTGASKGIGLAIAEEFLGFNAIVTVVARGEAELKAQSDRWTKQGLRSHCVAADMSTAEGRSSAMRFAVEKMGGLDCLINNVGTNIRKKAVDYTMQEYESLFAINLTSTFELCRLAYSELKKSGKGSVVNISSLAGTIAIQASGAPYAMTKAAMIQLTRNLACEWAQDNIRVNSVAPGFIETPLTEAYSKDESLMAKILPQIPLNRMGQPAEIAGLTTFLCMPSANYLTGQTILVDGGAAAKRF